MKKPGIPDPSSTEFPKAIKETVEIITGRRGTKIDKINTAGMTGDALTNANKINEILDRLQ